MPTSDVLRTFNSVVEYLNKWVWEILHYEVLCSLCCDNLARVKIYVQNFEGKISWKNTIWMIVKDVEK